MRSVFRRSLKRTGRWSNQSISPRETSSSSFSDVEDSTTQDKENEKMKAAHTSVYKSELEEDVKKLENQLQEEISVRLALTSAMEHSHSWLSRSHQLPDKTLELLDSLALLEITVSKLEHEHASLCSQIRQEKNEHRIVQYNLNHVMSPPQSLDHPPNAHSLNPEVKKERKVGFRSCLRDVILESDQDCPSESLKNSPNQLSEQMVLCMRHIYLFLSDSSVISSESVLPPSSPNCHLWDCSRALVCDSPSRDLSSEPQLDSESPPEECQFDPYGFHGKLEWMEDGGAYHAAVEVSWLSVGKEEFEYASSALQRFRLLVDLLSKVDLTCMGYNEKLAFWINVYNALMMHAFLAYGVPASEIKLFYLMQQASYVVGGHSFSAAEIEYVVLKMKPPAHRPQIALVLSLQKFKPTEEQKKLCVDQAEPLLAFALSCGLHSCPAVRIFKPENVNDLLQVSLKEYVQASVGINSRNGKLLLPQLLYSFAKDLVQSSALAEWICQFLPPSQAALVRQCSSSCEKRRFSGSKFFSVIPFDSRFRFLFLL